MQRRTGFEFSQDIPSVAIPAHINGHWLYFFQKRLLDLIGSIGILIFSLPIFILVAILIKADSPGPVFFVQKRVGAKRKIIDRKVVWKLTEFNCYKFRSMVCKADPSLHQAFIAALINNDEKGMALLNDNSKVRKLKHDPRVTRVGWYLRRSSIDELPQFINVLKGEMSLVGPRPAIPYEVEMYKPWYFGRLNAKPGITGLWQVTARSSVDYDEMIHLDIQYIYQQSFWTDLKILFKTPFVVLSRKGAV